MVLLKSRRSSQFEAAQTSLQRAKPKRRAEAEAEVEALREKLEEALRVRAALGRRVACLLATLEAARAVLVTDAGRALAAAHALVAAHSHAAMRARLADWPESTASLRVAAAASASDAAAAADFSYSAFAAAQRRPLQEADAAARAAHAEVVAAAAATGSAPRDAQLAPALEQADQTEGSAAVVSSAGDVLAAAASDADAFQAAGAGPVGVGTDREQCPAVSAAGLAAPALPASLAPSWQSSSPSSASAPPPSTLATAFDVSSATVDASAFCSLPVASIHAGLAHPVGAFLPVQPLLAHASGPARLSLDRHPDVPGSLAEDVHSTVAAAAAASIMPAHHGTSSLPSASPLGYGQSEGRADETELASGTVLGAGDTTHVAALTRTFMHCPPREGAAGAPPVMPDDHAAIAAAVAAMAPGQLGSVVHAYAPQAEDELALQPGQTIAIQSRDADGWWLGLVCGASGAPTGMAGRFPFTYIEILPDAEVS